MNRVKSLLVAAAVAALFSSASFATDDMSATQQTAEGKVKCVMTCKGKSECKKAKMECTGKPCEGKATEMMDNEQDCTAKGGTVEK